MVEKSAGLMMYYIENNKIKVFLVHPGGPFFINKDEAAWGIPKGRIDDVLDGEVDITKREEILKTALREFEEEVGFKPSLNNLIFLGNVKRKNGKLVFVWAFQGKGNEKFIKSNEFELEWPHKSGKMIKVAEVDKAKYFDLEDARKKIHKFQAPLLDMLKKELRNNINLKNRNGGN